MGLATGLYQEPLLIVYCLIRSSETLSSVYIICYSLNQANSLLVDFYLPTNRHVFSQKLTDLKTLLFVFFDSSANSLHIGEFRLEIAPVGGQSGSY